MDSNSNSTNIFKTTLLRSNSQAKNWLLDQNFSLDTTNQKSKISTSEDKTFDSTSTQDNDAASSESTIIIHHCNTVKESKKKRQGLHDNATMLKDFVPKRKYTKRRKTLDMDESFKEKLRKKVKKEEIGQADRMIQDSIKAESQNVLQCNNDSQNSDTQLILEEGKVVLRQQQTSALVSVHKAKKITTSQSFKTLVHTEKWTMAETRKFYRALEIFGTDFSMIATLFPHRTRIQVKNKYVKEEKSNPEKMNDMFNKTLKRRSLKTLKRVSALSFNMPLPLQAVGNSEAKNEFGTLIAPRRRTDSFNSMFSTDSLDRQIIEEMGDLLKGNVKFQI